MLSLPLQVCSCEPQSLLSAAVVAVPDPGATFSHCYVGVGIPKERVLHLDPRSCTLDILLLLYSLPGKDL